MRLLNSGYKDLSIHVWVIKKLLVVRVQSLNRPVQKQSVIKVISYVAKIL